MTKKYSFLEIFHEVQKHRKELFIANIIAILAVLISAPTPLFIPMLIDEVLLHKSNTLVGYIDTFFKGEHEAYFYVLVVLGLTLFLRLLFVLLSIWQSFYFIRISRNITYKIRKELLDHLERVSLKEMETTGGGKVVSMALVDIDTINNFLSNFISNIIVSFLLLMAISGILLWIHWQLALIILFVNPFVLLFSRKMGRKVGELKKEENRIISAFSEALSETLDLFWQVRASNKEHYFFSHLAELAEEIKHKGVRFGFEALKAQKFSYLLFLSGFEIFRALGVLMVAYSDLSIGMMLAVFGYLWVIVSPIQSIISMQYAYHNAAAALNRLNQIFEMEQEPVFPHKRDPFKETRANEIHLLGVDFSYDENKPLLEEVSISIPKAKKVALVGGSGNGKSTLAQLIAGFYQPDKGDILYDGISYKEIGLDVIREHLFLILQAPMLFNDTIRFNITFGKEVSDAKIQEALEIAQLKSFVDSLEEGLDTLVGKNGIKLSGGQRQRISIARMVVSDPNVVIFDESTSSLDILTEELLFDALESFLKERTTIIIAHRLSTIQKADYIYVLEEGRIAQEGTLQDLLSQEGHFANYFNKEEGSCKSY